MIQAFQVVLVVKQQQQQTNKQKNLPANAGDVRNTSLIPGSRRYPGGGHGNSLQYWWASDHGVTELDMTKAI